MKGKKKKETSIGAMKRLNLEWSGLAKLTAKILSYLPNEPRDTHSGGLLDIPVDSGNAYPELDQWLDRLAIVSTFIEGYARTTELMLEGHEGQAVVTALAQLDFIQNSRYVPPDIRRDLPINIAAIVRTASAANTLKAIEPRPRPPNRLRVGKFRALELHPNYGWKQLLTHLQGLKIVIDWDPTTIHWLNENDDEKTTSIKTFLNWKPE